MLLLRLLKLSFVESVVSIVSAFGTAHLTWKGDHNCFKDGILRFLRLFLVGSVASIWKRRQLWSVVWPIPTVWGTELLRFLKLSFWLSLVNIIILFGLVCGEHYIRLVQLIIEGRILCSLVLPVTYVVGKELLRFVRLFVVDSVVSSVQIKKLKGVVPRITRL